MLLRSLRLAGVLQVREMLAPPPQHLLIESSIEVDSLKKHMTLDSMLQQLAASPSQPGSSKVAALLARQALDLGSKQVRRPSPVSPLLLALQE